MEIDRFAHMSVLRYISFYSALLFHNYFQLQQKAENQPIFHWDVQKP